MLWYKRIRESKENLENHIENINTMIEKYNLNANDFKQQFPHLETSKPFNHLNNFETYELSRVNQGQASSVLP